MNVPDTELFSAYLDGELTAAEQVRVEQMLATSPEARQLLEELRALESTLQGLPLEKLDEDISARVLEVAERRMLLPAPPAEHGAGNKPSAGRAAEALETPDEVPIGWLGVPWREISWRGMFSRRALIWSGLIVATAVIIFFTSPPPQNPNVQQARLDEQGNDKKDGETNDMTRAARRIEERAETKTEEMANPTVVCLDIARRPCGTRILRSCWPQNGLLIDQNAANVAGNSDEFKNGSNSPIPSATAPAAPAKPESELQRKIVSKGGNDLADNASAPQSQVSEKPSQDSVAALQTRNAQTLRAANSQALIYACDASPDQLVSVIKQLGEKPEFFSPPVVQADGLHFDGNELVRTE